jgi:hypothetical protein
MAFYRFSVSFVSEVVYQIPSFDFCLSMCLVRGDVGWICHANNGIPCLSRCEMTEREMAGTSWLWSTDVTARNPTDCEHHGPRRFSPLPIALFPFQLRLVCINQPKVLPVTVTTNLCMNRMARRRKEDIRKCVRRSITAAEICGGRSMGTDCLISAQSVHPSPNWKNREINVC